MLPAQFPFVDFILAVGQINTTDSARFSAQAGRRLAAVPQIMGEMLGWKPTPMMRALTLPSPGGSSQFHEALIALEHNHRRWSLIEGDLVDVGFHGWDGLKSQFISKWHPENPQGWAWLSEHPTSKPGLIDIYLPWPIEEEREAIRALVADFTRGWLDTQTGRAPKTSAAAARL